MEIIKSRLDAPKNSPKHFMNAIDQGVIASRTIGIVMTLIGSITFADVTVQSVLLEKAAEDAGWSNYRNQIGILPESPDALHLHDAYFSVSTVVSPIASGAFFGFGILFLVFSRPIGRLIAPKGLS